MKIGLDLDGVFANFTDSYSALLTAETGVRFPLNSYHWPTEWNWDRTILAKELGGFGPAKEVQKKVWAGITDVQSKFWYELRPLADAAETLYWLSRRRATHKDQFYFITSRPGAAAKLDTEMWLAYYGFNNPTVLIVDNDHAKGQIAKALKLDAFVDDKPENCAEVNVAFGQHLLPEMGKIDCLVYLFDAPYNRIIEPELEMHMRGYIRVTSVREALEPLLEPSVAKVAA